MSQSHQYHTTPLSYNLSSPVLLKNVQIQLNVNPKDPQLSQRKRSVIRSVFTVGLFCKHFDMNSITQEAQVLATVSMSIDYVTLL